MFKKIQKNINSLSFAFLINSLFFKMEFEKRKVFEEIYHTNKNLVFNLALQYVQNKEDAEEITQDVFVSAYQSLNSFQYEAKMSTWLYRITIHKALDFIKAKNRKKRFALLRSIFGIQNELEIDTPVFDHPGVSLEQKESLEQLFKHINSLPDNQKTALILSKIEEKSQIEIAEIMQLSPKAVESLVQRAKVNLLKKLK